MVTEKDIIDMYVHLRRTNMSIPDEALDFMKETCLEKLDKLNNKPLELTVNPLSSVKEEANTRLSDLVSELQGKLVLNIEEKKRKLVYDAICYKLGSDVKLNEIEGVFENRLLGNGTNQIRINGELMLEFYSFQFDYRPDNYFGEISYRKFYGEDDV